MTKMVGIRELVRDTSILDRYDMIEIEDKKTKKPKGLYVSQKYAEDVKKMIEQKEQEEQKRRKERFMRYAGMLSGVTQEKDIGALKEEKEEKYGA